MSAAIDVGRYLARIGYDGPTTATPAVLSALTRAHACSIPFENIDVLLRRPIPLDAAALYRKLVLACRLQRTGTRWLHQMRHSGQWVDVHEFTLCGYTSTCPESHFHSELTMALARPLGRRTTLHDHTLGHWAADGSVERRRITGRAALRAALESEFGIVLAGAADPMLALERAIDGQPADASV